jgi:hypothetical protein
MPHSPTWHRAKESTPASLHVFWTLPNTCIKGFWIQQEGAAGTAHALLHMEVITQQFLAVKKLLNDVCDFERCWVNNTPSVPNYLSVLTKFVPNQMTCFLIDHFFENITVEMDRETVN